MRLGSLHLLAAAALLLQQSLGAPFAQASLATGQRQVTLPDTRGCAHPEAANKDPFNASFWLPCVSLVSYVAAEIEPGIFSVSKTIRTGGLKAKVGAPSGSTPENFQVAEAIQRIQGELLKTSLRSRENTERLLGSLGQLNNWLRMTRLPDEFLTFKGNTLFTDASRVLNDAAREKSRLLAYTMEPELKQKIQFVLEQIQPAAAPSRDFFARAPATLTASANGSLGKGDRLGESAAHPADATLLGAYPNAGNSASAGSVGSAGATARNGQMPPSGELDASSAH